jgi:electron transfer flavoprotein beta subunit
MNIAVCVKRIPKTAEADILIEKDGKDIKKDHLVFTLNDWDGYAVREAALLKEKHGGEVKVLTVGPEESKEVLTRCLAMGVDRALRIEEPSSIDGHRIAEILSQALKGQPFDLILTGVQAEDDGWGQVGGALAQMLGLPHAAIVNHIEITGGRASVRRELEGGIEEAVEVKLPAVLTIQTGINEPRYVSIMGIRKVAKKEIKTFGTSDLNLKAEEVGLSGSDIQLEKIFLPPVGEGAEMLEGKPEEIASKVFDILKDKGGLA